VLRKALVGALVLGGLCAMALACGGEEAPSPTPQAVAGVTPALSAPTPTATVASAPTPSPTPTPSPIPTPTPTPAPPSPTPTAPSACTAPAAPNKSGTLVGQGCVMLTVAPGGQSQVNAQQLAGVSIPCAGAASTHGWQVWLPSGASVNIQTAASTGGGPTTIASGNSGTASGYCGTIFVQNPGSVAVTVHVSWKMWDCTAAPC